jgi:anthranilate synthase component I
MISYQEFEQLANSYNVIPIIWTTLADMHTPVSTYLAVREHGVPSFLFESVVPDEKIGRYSFIGIRPIGLLKARGHSITLSEGETTRISQGSVFDVVRHLISRYRQAPVDDQQGFTGGVVGYLGYDCVRHLERLPLEDPAPSDTDDAMIGLFNTVIRFDHLRQRVAIIVNVVIDHHLALRVQYEEGLKQCEALELRLRSRAFDGSNFLCDAGSLEPDSDGRSFCEVVEKAKQYIVEGDIFQVVLSRRTQARFSGDPFPVYRALRVINPSPYLFYLDFGETKLIGSSPEVLVRVHGDDIELLPIAGTRARGCTIEEDRLLEHELLRDEKELAEHVMLVDLGRNDVGRVSEFGSVHVPSFKCVEKYSHVMHLVSEVKGRLKRGATPIDVLKSCFPAGTVSGAPKVRAMEIIQELESSRRGVYAGAVGYVGFDGTLDTCIAIRTIVAHRDTLSLQAGAGVVADSVPLREYQETVSKMRALIEAIAIASDGLVLADQHPMKKPERK